MAANPQALFERRQRRSRTRVNRTLGDRLRLSVFRSNQHIYAQIVDVKGGKTLVSASSNDKEAKLKSGGNVEAAKAVGKLVAERAKKAKIDTVVFDRGGYLYHGRVKALAEAAREHGLKF